MEPVIRAARLAREPWRLRPAPVAVPTAPKADGSVPLRPVAADAANAAYRDAYQAGFKAGERAGELASELAASKAATEAAQQALAPRLKALDALAATLGRALADSAAEAEPVLVEIAFGAVCRILGDALADPAGAAAVVRRVIEQVPERERLVVRLSPADHALLRGELPALAADGAGRHWELLPDERVALGGCLVETAGGTLDGRLETQLAQLAKALLAARDVRAEGLL